MNKLIFEASAEQQEICENTLSAVPIQSWMSG